MHILISIGREFMDMLFNYTPPIVTIPTAPIDGTTLELLAVRGIYPARENFHSVKDRYLFHCPLPGHSNDIHPSFSVHANGIQWMCFPCGVGGGPARLINLLGHELATPTEKPPKPPKRATKRQGYTPFTGCSLAQLSKAKNLPIEHLRSLGWHDVTYRGKPAVAIPYTDGLRYRVGLTGKDRFRWARGSKVSILGIDQLEAVRRGGWVLFVEGETDYAAGLLMGLPVMGIPGAGTWNEKWSLQFQGCQIYAWKEPDKAGETLIDKLGKSFWDIQVINSPEGIKDLCDLYDQAGEGAREFFEELRSKARRWRQIDSPKNVPNKERDNNSSSLIRDITPKSQLWENAEAYFPLPSGVRLWTVARAMYNHGDGKGLIAEFPSNAWSNPANAQLKRQRLFFNMLPRINGPELYMLKVAVDDWSDKSHEAIKKRINRAIEKGGEEAGHGWLWFNNALDRGYFLYLTSIPNVSGFEPFEGDIEIALVDGLRAIHPPRCGEETDGRFRPYGGSSNWISRVDGTGEKDRDKWQIVAVSDAPADYVQAEAECVAVGIPYEYARPYWRQQIGLGLEITLPFEDFVELCVSLKYHPTQAGRLALVVDP
jgi:hypothetical protein